MGRKKEEKTWRFGKIYLLGFPNSEVKKITLRDDIASAYFRS